MKKIVKILSVAIAVLLIVVPFSLTASASGVEDAILFGLEIIHDWVNDKCDDVSDMSGDDFANWYLSDSLDTTLFKLAGLMTPFAINCPADIYATNALKSGQYQVATVNKDMLNNLKDSANAFLSDYAKNIRYSTLADFNLQYYGDVVTNGMIILGSGGPIFYLGSSYLSSVAKQKINQWYYRQSNSNSDLVLFNGNSLGFPVIYCPSNAALYQNNVLLPKNSYYVPISSSEIICVEGNYSYLSSFFTSGDTLDSVTFEFVFGNLSSDGSPAVALRKPGCKIYKDGVVVGNVGDSTYTGATVCDLLEKYVGMHINVDGSPSYTPVTLPDDIPYDDSGNVVVCVPAGNGGDIVYLSPTEYNSYVDNGDIVVNDNSITDYYSDDTVNNVTNIYNNYTTNNYGSSYDDTNLINKLSGWFGDVNNNLKKIIKLLGDDEPVEPCYDNFSDCFLTAFPIIGQVKSISQTFYSACTTQTAPSSTSMTFTLFSSGSSGESSSDGSTGKLPEGSGNVFDNMSYDISIANLHDLEFTIDFDWYEPYRLTIRNFLSYIALAVYLAGLWKSLKSLLGVDFNAVVSVGTSIESSEAPRPAWQTYEKHL